MPIMLAYGTISADFLDIALRLFLGFWAVIIAIALAYFGYVLVTIELHRRSKPK